MNRMNRPAARRKKVVEGTAKVEKTGEGLGTGPVNNTGNYQDRKEKTAGKPVHPAREQNGTSFAGSSRPGSGMFGNSASGTGRPGGNMNSSHSSATGFFAGLQQGKRPGQNSSSRPQQSATPFQNARPQQSGTNYQSARPQQSGTQYQSAAPQNSGSQYSATQRQQTTRASGGKSGGSKLILIIIAAVVLFGGGKLTGLFGGNDSSLVSDLPQALTQTSTQTNTQSTGTVSSSSSGTGGLGDLLSLFTGSSGGSSAYDFSGVLSSVLGGSGSVSSQSASNQYFTSNSSDNTETPDMTVADEARDKRTVIKGNGKDKVTILVYMCGADLESQSGMATADLKEMTKATLGKNVNLIVYTGGARRWQNSVVSSKVNQIYQIRDGSLIRLEENMGTASMTTPSTLTEFIRYGKENFSANRMCLIFWDHGGGSLSGYGHDENHTSAGSMTLAGINTALKNAGVKFDFIGFDACLMATVENGIMLDEYADYMIASEEAEPGVGWYYTNWLTKLSQNTSMPTVEIGKIIADDFVDVCVQQCRGQATTLSVVDLAELSATVPKELADFGRETNELINNNEYNKVSTARGKTREFAQSSRIDQIDLVHFAKNLGTPEAKQLAKALQGAVKYNRTGGGISNAYGLSIYFPYKRASNVSQAVSTYSAIGMDDEYTKCIQEFASMEVSGQVASGTGISSYGSGFGSGFGGASGYAGDFTGGSILNGLLGGGNSSYSSANTGSLLSGLFGGSSSGMTGSILDLFGGRTLTAETAAHYIDENHFDADALVWADGKITLSEQQWSMVQDLKLNVFLDDGKGLIDLGTDNVFDLDDQGNLIGAYDGTWLSIDRTPVAYYYLNTVQDDSGEKYAITGYVPAYLNGTRVNLILIFDDENPDGYISGAQPVYPGGDVAVEAKTMIGITAGDQLQFICDYYDYEGNYQDSYKLGKPITLGRTAEIANIRVTGGETLASYCFTDLYQQNYWTPVIP